MTWKSSKPHCVGDNRERGCLQPRVIDPSCEQKNSLRYQYARVNESGQHQRRCRQNNRNAPECGRRDLSRDHRFILAPRLTITRSIDGVIRKPHRKLVTKHREDHQRGARQRNAKPPREDGGKRSDRCGRTRVGRTNHRGHRDPRHYRAKRFTIIPKSFGMIFAKGTMDRRSGDCARATKPLVRRRNSRVTRFHWAGYRCG